MSPITIYGRLATDPELKNTSNGHQLATGSLAYDTRGKKGNFIRYQAWGKVGELISKYLGKGRQAVLSGSLEHKTWQDQNGNKKEAHVLNVDAVDFVNDGQKSQSNQNYQQPQNAGQAVQQEFNAQQVANDEDIPF